MAVSIPHLRKPLCPTFFKVALPGLRSLVPGGLACTTGKPTMQTANKARKVSAICISCLCVFMIVFLLFPFEPAWSRLSALHCDVQTPCQSAFRLRPSKSLETRAALLETNEAPQTDCRRDATRLSGN